MIEEEDELSSDKLPLDTDLVRWYIQRRAMMRLSNERFIEYTSEMCKRLRNNIDETMEFLEECHDDEIEALTDIIEDLIYNFKSEKSEKVYNEFIEFLRELAENHPYSELKEELELTLLAIKDEEIENEAERG
jgi:hypothetical protein